MKTIKHLHTYGPLGIAEFHYKYSLEISMKDALDPRLDEFLRSCKGARYILEEERFADNAELSYEAHMYVVFVDAEDAVQFRLMME